MSRRALEHGARAGVLQRLLGLALGGQFLHALSNGLPVPGGQLQLRSQDHAAAVGKNTVAVSEIKVGDNLPLSRPVQAGDGADDLGHLPAVCSGVHGHRAPQGAGDAAGELQSGESPVPCQHRQPGQGDAGIRPQGIPLHPATVQAGSSLHQKPLHPLVRYQQIGAVAQKKGLHTQLMGGSEGGGGLLLRPGQGHQGSRPADAEGGVPGHGFVGSQFQRGTAAFQFLFQNIKTIHRDLHTSSGYRPVSAYFLIIANFLRN